MKGVTGDPGFQVTRPRTARSEEHTSELQSRLHLVCRLLLEKKKMPSTATSETSCRNSRRSTGSSALHTRVPATPASIALDRGCIRFHCMPDCESLQCDTRLC